MHNPFRYCNSSPEVIRLAVMMYVRYLWVSNSEFGRSIEAWDTIAWRLSSDLRCLAHEGSPAPPASPGRHSHEALQTRRRASRHR